VEYVRYNKIAENARAHTRMFSALTPHLDILESKMKEQAHDVQEKTYDHLKNLESKRDSYREACWRESYDIEEVDRILKTSEKVQHSV
jgi:septation ring formation regulator EzrA